MVRCKVNPFYTKKDLKTLRSDKIYKHQLGTSSRKDRVVFHEKDDTFGVAVYKSKSLKYLIIACYSTLTNEYHTLNADTPDEPFKVFQERVRGLEYSMSHYHDHFYIVTNLNNATNFKSIYFIYIYYTLNFLIDISNQG